jgi:hypothetical protein
VRCKLKKDVVPVFLNETVNCETYVQAILGQLFSELTEGRLCAWFQQDSATARTARMSVQTLSDIIGDRIIITGIWPTRSSDLNPSNFFFCGCLNIKVHKSNLCTEELKENIRKEIAKTPAERLQMVNQNLFRPCEESLYVEGHIFSTLCDL